MKKLFFSMAMASILIHAGCGSSDSSKENPKKDSIAKTDSTSKTEIIQSPNEKTTLTITGDYVNLRSDPSTSGTILQQFKSGDVCELVEKGKEDVIEGKKDFWYKIKYSDKTGWVFGSFIIINDNSAENNSSLPPENYKSTSIDQIGFELMDKERLGQLKINLSSSKVLEILGKPDERSEASKFTFDDLYHQTWHYRTKGVILDMSGKDTISLSVGSIDINEPCKFKTKRNIGIGSSSSEVCDAYKKAISTKSDIQVIAGTIYGGIIFELSNKKVTGIFIGASAE